MGLIYELNKYANEHPAKATFKIAQSIQERVIISELNCQKQKSNYPQSANKKEIA